jgi:hypothetical protein
MAGFPGRRHDWFPVLPVRLRHGERATPWFAAFVDSGSHCCLFDTSLATRLGLDLTKGARDVVRGLLDEAWMEVRFFEVTLIVAGRGRCDPPWDSATLIRGRDYLAARASSKNSAWRLTMLLVLPEWISSESIGSEDSTTT